MTTTTATTSLEERLRANPDSLVFSRLADDYLRNDEIDKAIETCKRGVVRHPDTTTGRIVLGRCYMRQERWKEAIDAFAEVCRLDSRNLMAIKLLGDLFARQGSSVHAGDLYRLVAAMDPFDAKMAAVAARVVGPEKTDLFGILADAEKNAGAVASTGGPGGKNSGASSAIHETIETPLDASADSSSKGILDTEELTASESVLETIDGTVFPSEPAEPLRQGAGAPSDAHDSAVAELLAEPAVVKTALPADDKTDEASPEGEVLAAAPKGVEPSSTIDIVTSTLAEIYFQQGQLRRALAIYRSLLNRDPENDQLKKSIDALNAAIASGMEGMPTTEQERGRASRKIMEEPAPASGAAGLPASAGPAQEAKQEEKIKFNGIKKSDDR